MAENERTYLLPAIHHHHEEEAKKILLTKEKSLGQAPRDRKRQRQQQHRHFWLGCAGVTVFVMLALAVVIRSRDSLIQSSDDNDHVVRLERTQVTITGTAATPTSNNNNPFQETEPDGRDAHVELWDEWKRQSAETEVVPPANSHFHQHIALAQEIINWEGVKEQMGDWWRQALHKAKPAVEKNTQKAWKASQKQASQTYKQVGKQAQRASKDWEKQTKQEWNKFLKNSGAAMIVGSDGADDSNSSWLDNVENEEWWHNMSDWFQETWTTNAHEAHKVWLEWKEKAAEQERVLWNYTVTNERIWYAHSITQMRKLGTHMRSWWDDMSAQVVDDEQVIQEGFKEWWNRTETRERRWWQQTRWAFRNFTALAAEKERLWWHMVQQAAGQGWNATQTKTRQFWHETVVHAQHGWNVTEREAALEAHQVWNASVSAEQAVWHALQRWFRAHATYAEELAQPVAYLNTTGAYSWLMNGYGWFDFSHDFFRLQNGWDAQINQAYCGVAASTAVLNSYRGESDGVIELPVDAAYQPYHYATQTSLLQTEQECINQHVMVYNDTFDGIYHAPGGLSMSQVQQLLQCHLPRDVFEVTAHYMDPTLPPGGLDLDIVRRDLALALEDAATRVIISYHRPELGQVGGGHFSPLAAYSETEDRFLIMDVSKYKYPPVWVPAARLLASMATVDTCGRAPNLLQVQGALPSLLESKWGALNQTEYLRQLKQLGCQPTYRGFLIVRPIRTRR